MESTSSPHHNGGQTETTQHPPPQQMLGHMVPVVHDALTFDDRHTQRMKEMEKFVNDEAKRRKKEWEKDVERMREEFLYLQPSDETKSGSTSCTNSPSHYQLTQIQKHSRHSSGEPQAEGITSTLSNSSLTKVGFIRKDDDLIAKRRGSTDVLDSKKMKTLFLEYPGSGLRYKLRFDLSDFEPENVHVTADNSRIMVKATRQVKCDETGDLVERKFDRKIEKPAEVDHTKLKSCLTTDGILIIEAPLPPKSLGLRKTTSSHASPSRAQQSNATLTNTAAVSSSISIRSAGSPPLTPTNCSSPFKREKRGQVYFHNDEDSASGGRRKMTLVLDIGLAFGAKEITILIIKDNRIRVKARHEERTPEKLVKNKFTKEFELSERIETYSLRAGLTTDGKLIVKALGKGHCDGLNKVSAGELVAEEINCLMDNNACNVLDLSSFPPTTPQLIASSYNGSV